MGNWDKKEIEMAINLQNTTVAIIESWGEGSWNGFNVQKAILKMTGIDFGGLRWPQKNLDEETMKDLGTVLYKLGVNITHEWIRPEYFEGNEITIPEKLD